MVSPTESIHQVAADSTVQQMSVLTSGYYLKLIPSLLFFLVVMVGILQLTRTYQRKKFTGEIHVIDRAPIENGITLVLVEFRNYQYLISTGGKEVKLIDKLDKTISSEA